MGKITGFMEIKRESNPRRPVAERIRDYREYELKMPEEKLRQQGARCMDCGIPFCHRGCPLGNIIPDWNDLVYRGRWREAIERLHWTNNFPEFTGRVCPAPCEEACVLNINNDPVTIKQLEKHIVDHAWAEGWIAPQPNPRRTGKKVAVVGSGPSGMACAQQLARAGHSVTLYERADRIGGLLRYGIPDFKLEKWQVERRVEQMKAEGVEIVTNCRVGTDLHADQLQREFDAIVLTIGSTKPRDLPVPGRDLKGIHFAMEFLPQQNKRNAGDTIPPEIAITATGKRVVILGGGDTGSDCLGTSNRQGALSVHQFELLPVPPEKRTPAMPWPDWPMILRTSTSHEEGVIRDWSINTKFFEGENGVVKKLHGVRLNWKNENGRMTMEEIPGSEFTLDCDLVLLALGFLGPEPDTIVAELGLNLDPRGNIACVNYQSSVPGVFAAGDARRGQSLVVWAIWEGRECARAVDTYLMGETFLPASPEL
ncbi:MAG TPA: glutamate synthase subunit beta [Candidatus Binataceae bacterium]|jgi:glutamate synthase (NADPH/NADH) small chain|nr:glutamate synthase subunit beta [Candidatus Binataceae bacterium]